MYRIEITPSFTSHVTVLRYEERAEALAAWDKHVDLACPGDKLKLMDLDTERTMSVYNPVKIHMSDDYAPDA